MLAFGVIFEVIMFSYSGHCKYEFTRWFIVLTKFHVQMCATVFYMYVYLLTIDTGIIAKIY